MSTIINNVLGLKVSVSVPSTVEEYDLAAGKTGAALESAIYNVIYRSWNAQFRAKFAEKLETLTGIARATEPVLNKDGTPKLDDDKEPVLAWTETEAEYVSRVYATLVKEGKATDVESARGAYQSEADAIAATIAFDPKERESKATGPKKVAKKWVDAATLAESKGILAAVAAKLSANLGYAVEATVTSVAAALFEDNKRKAAAAEAAQKAELGL